MFSAFSFENHMQAIKKLIWKGHKPLQQICRKLLEQENICSNSITSNQSKQFEMCIEHSEGPLIDVKMNKQYKKVKFHNCILALSDANNCCCLSDGSLIIIRNFVNNDEEPKIIGEKFQIPEHFFTLPCESSKLHKAGNLGPLQYWYLRKVTYKCMKLKLIIISILFFRYYIFRAYIVYKLMTHIYVKPVIWHCLKWNMHLNSEILKNREYYSEFS